jgi:hypothetical protein
VEEPLAQIRSPLKQEPKAVRQDVLEGGLLTLRRVGGKAMNVRIA